MIKYNYLWTVFLFCIGYFGLHLGSSYLGSVYKNQLWSLEVLSKQLLYLDSSWYVHIASQGYINAPHLSQSPSAVYAFFPLWPSLLAVIEKVYFIENIQLLGSFIASSLFLLTLIFICKNEMPPSLLRPKTPLGLAFFVFSPGSWVFCTNHTESIFLFLSWTSLYLSMNTKSKKMFIFTSVIAGFAALTRNQGILLCIVVAFSLMKSDLVIVGALKSSGVSSDIMRKKEANWSLRQVDENVLTTGYTGVLSYKYLVKANKMILFAISGLISGFIYMLWPIYQWYHTGNPFASTATQVNWHIVSSFSEYIENFFWVSTSNLPRRILFLSILLIAINMLRTRENNVFGLYLLLSVLVWPVQGNSFAQAYRFSSVLFPFWFFVGDFIYFWLQSYKKAKHALTIFVVATMLYWTYYNSQNYFLPQNNAWPY
jgi:hypothetical protein